MYTLGIQEESLKDLMRRLALIIGGYMKRNKRKSDTPSDEPERRESERRETSDRRKTPRNYGTPWTEEQIQLLKDLLGRETPLRQLGQILGRTPSDIEDKAKEIDDHDKKVEH
jgi:hypothetical protein